MQYQDMFVQFLDKLKNSKNEAILEAVKKGYTICCEGNGSMMLDRRHKCPDCIGGYRDYKTINGKVYRGSYPDPHSGKPVPCQFTDANGEVFNFGDVCSTCGGEGYVTSGKVASSEADPDVGGNGGSSALSGVDRVDEIDKNDRMSQVVDFLHKNPQARLSSYKLGKLLETEHLDEDAVRNAYESKYGENSWNPGTKAFAKSAPVMGASKAVDTSALDSILGDL